MKKYSSYFNKRYFPEPEDGLEEEGSLGSDSLVEDDSPFGDAGLLASEIPSVSSLMEEEPPKIVKAPAPAVTIVPTTPAIPAAYAAAMETRSEVPATATEPKPPLSKTLYEPKEPSDMADAETTVISKSAIINGEISVSGDIHMYGKIKGNITATGNLQVAGKVIGNVSGNDVELNTCEIKGDVNASGFVFMDKDSAVVGNLNSQDITLDGKVKGDVSATHKVYVRSNALIIGNVRAATIAIDEGAALQGQVIIANKQGDEQLNISDESEGNE